MCGHSDREDSFRRFTSAFSQLLQLSSCLVLLVTRGALDSDPGASVRQTDHVTFTPPKH